MSEEKDHWQKTADESEFPGVMDFFLAVNSYEQQKYAREEQETQAKINRACPWEED